MTKIRDKLLELVSMFATAIGVLIGMSEPSDARDFYYGDNYGGDVSHPPEGSVISAELSAENGYPTAVDTTNGTYYTYVVSHWFDPQQMAKFPSDVWMYGISPYDHSSGGGLMNGGGLIDMLSPSDNGSGNDDQSPGHAE